jgi:plasmid stabilization system protein ParE
MIVTITEEAERDLEVIGDYIALDDPVRAIGFISELREKCLTLAELPERFPLVVRFEAQGVRRRVHGNYLIFYRIEREQVVVLHILHGAQDYGATLFP